MADPFDLGALRKCTPKYLGMDSLRDALHETENAAEAERIDAESEDVSMTDQILIDEEVEVEDDNESKISNEKKSGELVTLRADKVDENCESGLEVQEDNHSALFRKVMTPTQAGAQQALHHQQPYPYNYEVSMPIPTPWHNNMKYTLSTYLQLAFNAVLGVIFLWLVSTVRADVNKKISERQSALTREAHYCQEQFLLNNCRTGKTPPHLVENRKCLELEECMDIDPYNVRWLSMYASLVAEVANELIVPLHLRTIVSILCFVMAAICAVGANYWFGFWRARTLFQSKPNTEKRDEIKVQASPSIWRN